MEHLGWLYPYFPHVVPVTSPGNKFARHAIRAITARHPFSGRPAATSLARTSSSRDLARQKVDLSPIGSMVLVYMLTIANINGVY